MYLIVLILILVLAGCAGGGPEAAEEENTGEEQTSAEAMVITADNAETGVEMKIGSQAVVKLDPAFSWRITTTPSLVLDNVDDAVLGEGEQALLEAKLNGSAVIQATGRALCRDEDPPCDTPGQQMRIEVKVSN
jgi:hypothetical protein